MNRYVLAIDGERADRIIKALDAMGMVADAAYVQAAHHTDDVRRLFMDAVNKATPWATTADVPPDDIANACIAALFSHEGPRDA